jgi:hypothetical protein
MHLQIRQLAYALHSSTSTDQKIGLPTSNLSQVHTPILFYHLFQATG